LLDYIKILKPKLSDHYTVPLKQYTKYVTKCNKWHCWYSIGFRSHFTWTV